MSVIVFARLALGLCVGIVRAGEARSSRRRDSGTSSFAFLNIPTGARAAAMGPGVHVGAE